MSHYVDPNSNTIAPITPIMGTTPTSTRSRMGFSAAEGSSLMMQREASGFNGSPISNQHADSSLIFGSVAVGAEDEYAHEVIDLSNGIRIEFIRRSGWGKGTVESPTIKKKGSPPLAANKKQRLTTDNNNNNGDASNPIDEVLGIPLSPSAAAATLSPDRHCGDNNNNVFRLSGRRVTPFSDIVIDYSLLKAIDVVGGPTAGPRQYRTFDYAASTPVADRMTIGDPYECQKDFSMKFVPSYGDCPSSIICGLNLCLPYLREGDEVLVFIPAYLGPYCGDVELGSDFRPSRVFDEVEQQYVDPPKAPAYNKEFAEHSYAHVVVKRVYPEFLLAENRYITKTVLVEGLGGGGSNNNNNNKDGCRRLVMDDTDEPLCHSAAPHHHQRQQERRRVAVGSVVTYDIGEENDYLGKPLFFKTVVDCVVAAAATSDELDIVLMSLSEGEYSVVRVGACKYHIKLLAIKEGTALGEVVGDAATELARGLKDAGNAVLSTVESSSAKMFASPARLQHNNNNHRGGGTAGGALSTSSAFDEPLELLAQRYYCVPPADLSFNPFFDGLSTFVVRPPRSTFARCVKRNNNNNNNNNNNGTKSATGSEAPNRYSDLLLQEATYRALMLYQYAEEVLTDTDTYYPASSGCRSSSTDDNTVTTTTPPTAIAPYSVEERSHLLGTVCGNAAQVHLNLGFPHEAERYATEAVRRCRRADIFKQYYRRAKARVRAYGPCAAALDDLMMCRDALVEMGVGKLDGRFVDVEREITSVYNRMAESKTET